MIITEHMFFINAQFHIEFRQNVVFVWLTKPVTIDSTLNFEPEITKVIIAKRIYLSARKNIKT